MKTKPPDFSEEAVNFPKTQRKYVPPEEVPGDSAELQAAVNDRSVILRMRRIARLELLGLDVTDIATELSKLGESWQIATVARLMGVSSGMTPAERTAFRRKYELVREEIQQAKLLEVENEILEMRSLSVTSIKQFLNDNYGTKEGADMALKMIRASGVGGDIDRKIVEHRMSEETVAALKLLAQSPIPEGRLHLLVEANSGAEDPVEH